MARKGYYHGDEFIEYKRGNLAGKYGSSSKNMYAKKTVYNSGTYNKSNKSCLSTSNISKKDKNSFLTSDGKYSKRLESNKCIFCGKTYNRNLYMLCPHCFIKCSQCGKKYNTIRNKSCPHCGKITPKTSNKSKYNTYNKSKNKTYMSPDDITDVNATVYDHNALGVISSSERDKYRRNKPKPAYKSKYNTDNNSKNNYKHKSNTSNYKSRPLPMWEKCPKCGEFYHKYKYSHCPHCKGSKSSNTPIGLSSVVVILVIIILMVLFYLML